MFSSDLTLGSFIPATNTSTTDNGTERTITDNTVRGIRTFYKVNIAKP